MKNHYENNNFKDSDVSDNEMKNDPFNYEDSILLSFKNEPYPKDNIQSNSLIHNQSDEEDSEENEEKSNIQKLRNMIPEEILKLQGSKPAQAQYKLRKILHKKSTSVLNKYKKKREKNWLHAMLKSKNIRENRVFWFIILQQMIEKQEIQLFKNSFIELIQERLKKDIKSSKYDWEQKYVIYRYFSYLIKSTYSYLQERDIEKSLQILFQQDSKELKGPSKRFCDESIEKFHEYMGGH